MGAQRPGGLAVSVRGKVVEDHHGSGLDLGDQHVAHASGKCRAVYSRQVNACIHREALPP